MSGSSSNTPSDAILRQRTLDTLNRIESALRNGSNMSASSGDRGSTQRGSGAGSGTNNTATTQNDAQQARRDALQNRSIQELEDTLSNLITSIESLKNSVEGGEQALSDDQKQLLQQQREEAQAAREIILEAKRGELEQSEIVQNSSRNLGRALAGLTEPLRTSWNAFEDYNLSMNRSISAQSSMLAGMVEGANLQNTAYDKYITKLLDASETLSSFTNLGRELNSSRELSEAIQELTEDGKVFEALLREHGDQTAEYIETLYQLREAGSELAEHQQEVLRVAVKNRMIDEHGRAQNAEAMREHTNQIKADMIRMQEIAVQHVAIAKLTQSFHDRFGKYTSALFGDKGPFGMIILGLTILGNSITKVYDQFVKAADIGMLGSSQLLGSFARLQQTSVKLGISFDETAKIFQENRRMAYSVGDNVGDFADALDEGQKSLILLGMGNEEAAKSAVDFAKNATKAGIDITSNDKVKKAMKAQTEAYGRLKVLTGASASEFKALNDELFDAQAIQQQMNGLSQDERTIRMEAMFKLREDFVKLGLSAQSANKALVSIQDLGKEKLADRFTQAAKFQQLAGVLGMKNAVQLGQIVRKGDRATVDEKEMLMKSAVEMQKRADERRRGSYGDENLIQALEGGLTGPLAALMDQGREASKTTDALGKFVQSTFGKQTVDGDIKIPPWAATLIDIGHSISTVLSNPIVQALGGIGLAVWGWLKFAKPLGNTITSMRDSLLDIVRNTAANDQTTAQGRAASRRRDETQRRRRGVRNPSGNRASPAPNGSSRLGGRWGRIGMGGAGGVLAGLATDAIMDHQTDPNTGEMSTGGKWASVLGSALSGASLGMMTGNPLGIAAGAVGGGLLGAWNAFRDSSSSGASSSSGVASAHPSSGTSPSSIYSSYPSGTNPPSIYSPQPSATTSSKVTPIGSSTSGTSSSSSSNEADAPVIRLSKDTITKLGNYLTTLNDTQTKSLNIEQDQLDMLAALVTASDEAYKNAKSLKPIPGHSSLFGRGGRYEYIN